MYLTDQTTGQGPNIVLVVYVTISIIGAWQVFANAGITFELVTDRNSGPVRFGPGSG